MKEIDVFMLRRRSKLIIKWHDKYYGWVPISLGIAWYWLSISLESLQEERGITFCTRNNSGVFPTTVKVALEWCFLVLWTKPQLFCWKARIKQPACNHQTATFIWYGFISTILHWYDLFIWGWKTPCPISNKFAL